MSSLLEGEWAVAESERGMTQDKVKRLCQGAAPLKTGIFLRGLRSLPEGEWAVDESKRGMTQDEVKIIWQDAVPWKTAIFLRGRVELFTEGWVSCCLVPKRNDAGWSENCMPRCSREWEEWRREWRREWKNGYKIDGGNRKGKYKHLFWCNLMCKKDFSFSAKDS